MNCNSIKKSICCLLKSVKFQGPLEWEKKTVNTTQKDFIMSALNWVDRNNRKLDRLLENVEQWCKVKVGQSPPQTHLAVLVRNKYEGSNCHLQCHIWKKHSLHHMDWCYILKPLSFCRYIFQAGGKEENRRGGSWLVWWRYLWQYVKTEVLYTRA